MSDNVPLTVQEIAEIVARLAAVTPGEWVAKTNTHYAQGWLEVTENWVEDADGFALMDNLIHRGRGFDAAAHAAFIAHAPTDMRRLMAELQRAHDERDALAGQLAAVREGLEQANDTNRVFEEWLNKYWGLLYPENPQGWEYPGQVFNHIQIELGRLAERAALAGADTLGGGAGIGA